MNLLNEYRNFQDLSDQFTDNIIVLAILNSLIKKKTCYFPIDITIDYGLTPYEKGLSKPYYFTSTSDFEKVASKIFNTEFGGIYFILDEFESSNDYLELYDEVKFIKNYQADRGREEYIPDIADVLTLSHEIKNNKHPYYQSRSSFDFDDFIWDNYSLKNNGQYYFENISVHSINNNSHVIKLHGTIFMDVTDIQRCYVEYQIECANADLPFYKELLLESYSLLAEGNNKMAFFNAFAAFENFVNVISGKENAEERLAAKFKDAFNNHPKIAQFASFDSYTKLATALRGFKFEKTRNDIAHGNATSVDWKSPKQKQAAIDMYIFTSIVILSFESEFKNFNELRGYLKKLMDDEN